MGAELHICSDVPPVTWEDFIAQVPTNPHPLGSIALDGYVSGPPNFDPEGPYYNANHHEGVVRLATLSTAQQIFVALQMGMRKAFTRDGSFAPRVFVNDCDQDVCLAAYLLLHPDVASAPTPALNRLVNVAGILDVTGGLFPFKPDMEILGRLAWVFEPYTDFRASGEMKRKDNAQYEMVIRKVIGRISTHLSDGGESIPLDPRYEVIGEGKGKGWKMIRELGKDGRVGAIMDGVEAFVTVEPFGEDRWRYVLGKLSQFIPFDIPGIIAQLNAAEGNETDLWGGGDTFAGSPRVGGSKLFPDVVTAIINGYLLTKKR